VLDVVKAATPSKVLMVSMRLSFSPPSILPLTSSAVVAVVDRDDFLYALGICHILALADRIGTATDRDDVASGQCFAQTRCRCSIQSHSSIAYQAIDRQSQGMPYKTSAWYRYHTSGMHASTGVCKSNCVLWWCALD
jgi:hypothetical protein